MGRFADALDAMILDAWEESEVAWARLHGRERIEVGLVPGYFTHASEDQIVAKLAAAGRELFLRRTREFYRALSAISGVEMHREPEPETDRERAFREWRRNIPAEGTSIDGLVTVTAIGMVHWNARCLPGSFTTMDEATFLRDVGEGATSALQQHRAILRRRPHFG